MVVASQEELEGLKSIGRIVAFTREEMLKNISCGITTGELDRIAEKVLAQFGARSAPRLSYNFPGTTCISINDEAAHGIPGTRIIQAGDMVNVDISAELNGFFADTGASVTVEPKQDLRQRLCECAASALGKALATVKAGAKLSHIGRAISTEAQNQGFHVIKNLCGHGIGRKLHEPPYEVLNFYHPAVKLRLTRGLVLAVETFISSGAEYVEEQPDGWTLKAPGGTLVAQYEHTIVVTDDKPVILTAGN